MKISWDKLSQELQDIRKRTEQLANNLSADELARRPDPAKWSIAECISHLNLTAATIQPKIDSAIKQGKENKIVGQGPFKSGLAGSLVLWIAEPPPKFKIKAPKKILPPASIGDPSQVIGEFMRIQDEWARLAREADGLNLDKIKVSVDFRGLPPIRLGAMIPWMMAHQRRHLLQAEAVKQQIQSKAAPA